MTTGHVLLGAVVLALVGGQAWATLIDTTSAWDGSAFTGGFGNNASGQVVGETVTVPTNGDTTLNSFTFYLNPSAYGNLGSVMFHAYVYAWDGTKATGADLYKSAETTIVPTGAFQAVTFTPHVALNPGAQYVLFLSTLEDQQAANTGAAGVAPDINPANAYTGGKEVYIGGVKDFSAVTTVPWTTYPDGRDLAFKATFVPEPSTFAWCGLGALGVLGYASRRRIVGA